jgi:lipid-binding SYLF domain-containing protein
MRRLPVFLLSAFALLLCSVARADSYTDTIETFKAAGESAKFFHDSYAYAIFPNVGEGGFLVGGIVGKGRVYVHGRLIGDSTMGGVTIGLQAGGKVFTEIIFFEDKRALDEFESGSFEFQAGLSAIAITAGAGASAGTSGAQANASGSDRNATTVGGYDRGMAVFTVAKGGLMYAATIGGQKFSFTPRGAP